MTIKTFEQTTPGKRIQVIFNSIQALKPIYDQLSEDEKQYLLTVQDDFLWVGTNVKFFWSGLISEECRHTKQKCQQHRYPRLLATKLIFDNLPDNIDEFKKMFIELCQFDYTTSNENKKLIPYQKEGIFETPEIAYEKAGIIITHL